MVPSHFCLLFSMCHSLKTSTHSVLLVLWSCQELSQALCLNCQSDCDWHHSEHWPDGQRIGQNYLTNWIHQTLETVNWKAQPLFSKGRVTLLVIHFIHYSLIYMTTHNLNLLFMEYTLNKTLNLDYNSGLFSARLVNTSDQRQIVIKFSISSASNCALDKGRWKKKAFY